MHDLNHSQLLVLLLLTISSFSIFGYKYIISLILVLIIWWCPCVKSSLILLEEGFTMTNAFSWQNVFSLYSVSFCTPRSNLPVTPGISCLPIFTLSTLKWKGHFFGVLVLGDLVGLQRTVQFQLLHRHPSVISEIAPKNCISDSCLHDGYSISSKGFLPTVVDIMVIWDKFTHSSPFHLAES